MGATFSDLDTDGDLDLYVANDTKPNRLYDNVPRPGGAEADPAGLGFRFEELAGKAGVADPGAGMGVAVGDDVGDGLEDLFVANARNQGHAVYRAQESDLVYPSFMDVRDELGVALAGSTGWGVFMELQWRELPGILAGSAILSGAVVFIVATNNILLYAVTLEQLADKLGALFFAITQNKILILLMLNALLLFLGAIVDCLPLMILFIPVVKPLFATLGVDPVHAGVMIVLNMTIGLSTPPVGTSLFIAASIARTDLQSATRHMTPFLIAVILVLLLVTYFPRITLWFPDLVMK